MTNGKRQRKEREGSKGRNEYTVFLPTSCSNEQCKANEMKLRYESNCVVTLLL